jgi:hypothetical protein
VITNNGNGGFTLSYSQGTGPYPYRPASVTAADVNGDGKVDLIFADYSDGLGVDAITILTNNGSGGFVLYTNIPNNGVAVLSDFVTTADVNGDGKVDLILANQGNGGNSSLIVLTNNGSGVFVQAAYIAMGNSGANWIAAADFNGDGKVDIACANRNSNSVSVFFNASIFPPPTATPPLNINPSGSGIQVSWPSASAGWSLQQNPNLTTMPWGPGGYSGYTISDDGTTKSLTIPSPPGNLFFRLFHP